MSNETNKGSGKRSSREVLNNHGVSWEIPEWEDILAAMEEYAAQQAPAGQCSICRGTGAYEKIVNGTFLGVFPCATCNGTGWLRSQQPAEPSPTNEEILQQTVKSQALTIEMLKSKAPSAGVSKERVREILEDHYEWLVKGDGEALYSSVANRINWYLATFAPSSEQPTKAN